jgi:hypothetical protein
MDQAFDRANLTQGADRLGRLDLDQGLPGRKFSFMLRCTMIGRLARKSSAFGQPDAFGRSFRGLSK